MLHLVERKTSILWGFTEGLVKMEEAQKRRILNEAEKAFANHEANDVFRTIAHLFPHMTPVLHDTGADRYVIFFDLKSRINITVALD